MSTRTVSTTRADLTVGDAAALVGVSVRTLHHWDAIGLVCPSGHTPASYRIYSADDIARIHRVLVYRELGFPLAEIARLLDDPRVDADAHLTRQRGLLLARISRLQEMVTALDRMRETTTMNPPLTPQALAELFGTDWDPSWQDEAEQRWGSTSQWEQSRQRTAVMTRESWQQVKAETDELETELGEAFRSGIAPGSERAEALVDRHRGSITRFYDCSRSMQVLLARMYLQDTRFTEHYDSVEPGLAAWLVECVEASARAHGVDPDTARWE